MTKKISLTTLLISISILAFSQAGYGVYKFLDLPVSSRLAAIGGTNISIRDNDLNFAFGNPALLTAETNNVIGLSMANYLADIKFGSAVYGKTIGTNNFFAIGIQYIDYGVFKYTNETNSQTEDITFSPKEMALSIMYARPITDKITVGATLKPINSVLLNSDQIGNYTSYGLAMDAGISYCSSSNLFSSGLVFRNIGTQFKGYYSNDDGQHLEPLPFNIQLGTSIKLAHAPLRFSITMNNLQHWDLSYQSTNQSVTTLIPGTTKTPENKISFIDMAFRHSIVAIEFVPSKNFYLSMAYNHRQHQEMSVSGFKSSAGFSFGGGIKLYKFHVGFGTTKFLGANSTYQFSISTALNEFRL